MLVVVPLFFSFSQASSSRPPAAFSFPPVFAAWAAASEEPEPALRPLAEACAVVDARPQAVLGGERVEPERDGRFALAAALDGPSPRDDLFPDEPEPVVADWLAESPRVEHSLVESWAALPEADWLVELAPVYWAAQWADGWAPGDLE